MQGLRIFSNATFGELFESVFPHLSERHWLTLTDAFEYPADWVEASAFDEGTDRFVTGPLADFEKLVVRVEKGNSFYGFSSAAKLFPTYAQLVSEDWSSLFALSAPVSNPLLWLEVYYATRDRSAYLSECCEAVFLNVDAAFWEFYSNRVELLAGYVLHLERQGFRYARCVLSEAHL